MSRTWDLWCFVYNVWLQKRKVLSDPSLPPEFRISLAKSLRHDLFFQVRTDIDVLSLPFSKLIDMSLQIPFLIGIQERVRATFTAEVNQVCSYKKWFLALCERPSAIIICIFQSSYSNRRSLVVNVIKIYHQSSPEHYITVANDKYIVCTDFVFYVLHCSCFSRQLHATSRLKRLVVLNCHWENFMLFNHSHADWSIRNRS